MNGRRLTDAQISQALRAHLPEQAQAGLRERVLDAAVTTTQERPLPSFAVGALALRGQLGWAEGVRTSRWAWVLVAAILALVAAAAIFVGSQRGPLLAIQPPPTPIPTPSAEVSLPAVSPSLELTWTKVVLDERSPRVAWIGDRFVLVDEDSRAVRTSTDGASWHALQPGDPDPGYYELLMGSFASRQDDVVGWWNSQVRGPDVTNATPQPFVRDVVRIVRPRAETTATTPFKGRVGSIGIGPLGFVARVHSTLLDWDAWVTSKLGPDWVPHMTFYSYEDGILRIETDDGRSLNVVWADEGFEPGDFQDRGFGWYSPDGERWTAIPDFPADVTEVVGVSDGFIAQVGDEMWHSSDGMTWRNLGKAPGAWEGSERILSWMSGALVTDGIGRFDVVTSQGYTELPMASELPAGPDSSAAFGTGSLGLVSIRDERGILFTPNGVHWSIEPMPAEMAEVDTPGPASTVAVGDRSVLVLSWAGTREAPIPSLWLGILEP